MTEAWSYAVAGDRVGRVLLGIGDGWHVVRFPSLKGRTGMIARSGDVLMSYDGRAEVTSSPPGDLFGTDEVMAVLFGTEPRVLSYPDAVPLTHELSEDGRTRTFERRLDDRVFRTITVETDVAQTAGETRFGNVVVEFRGGRVELSDRREEQADSLELLPLGTPVTDWRWEDGAVSYVWDGAPPDLATLRGLARARDARRRSQRNGLLAVLSGAALVGWVLARVKRAT